MMRKIFSLITVIVLLGAGFLTLLPARPALAVDRALRVSVLGGGTVTVTPPGDTITSGYRDYTFADGTAVSLVATPNSGTTFLGWDTDYEPLIGSSSSTVSVTMGGDYYMYAMFSGTGGGGGGTTSYSITATAGANGTISPSGTTSVTSGGGLAYIITPASGYRIANVQVDGASVGAVATYTFSNVTAAHTITATFTLNTFNITASAGANGTISPAGAVAVSYGGSQTFAITPASGYHVTGVLVDGASVGMANSYTFSNVTAAHTITASFAINTYTITATAGANGAITPTGAMTVNFGGSQSYTITPATGYHVNAVLVDGVAAGAVTSYSFTGVIGDHTISASFAINTYAITSTAGAHGTISPSGTTTINHGGSQSYTITPATGYHVDTILVDGAPVAAAASYAFSNITAAHAIAVSFAINTYVIKPTAGKHGSIAPFMDVKVDYGETQVFTFTPETGYRVADVTVDGVSVGAVPLYEIPKINKDHTIGVTFAIGWPYYAAMGLGVVLVFLLGYLLGRRSGGGSY